MLNRLGKHTGVKEQGADPGFHRAGGANLRRGTNLSFAIIFAENCMKMKKLYIVHFP